MKMLVAALALLVSLGAHADPTVLAEDFDVGLGSFSAVNASPTPTGAAWFPGNAGVFGGAPGGYAASNFDVAAPGTSIAAWLISPEITFVGQTVSFFARTEDLSLPFLDGVTLMVSTNGASTNLADFVPLLAIGPGTLTDAWTMYSALLGSIGSGRIAFLYSVGNSNDANYVGVDTVRVGTDGTPIPEPGSLALVAFGLGLIGLFHWRNRRAR
jgi:hypothetical protein